MIYDAVLHEDMLTAALPAPVHYATDIWVHSSSPTHFLVSVNDDGTGTLGEPGEVIPDIEESVIGVELWFEPPEEGDWPAEYGVDTDAEAEGGILTINGTGTGYARTVIMTPDELNFIKAQGIPAVPKGLTLRASGGKIALVYDRVTVDPVTEFLLVDSEGNRITDSEGNHIIGITTDSGSMYFSVKSLSGSVLQPEVAAVDGQDYYLHPDGSINTNHNGSIGRILTGVADGRRVIDVEE
jgi:hypothetical protein